jgi:hypothetical protein
VDQTDRPDRPGRCEHEICGARAKSQRRSDSAFVFRWPAVGTVCSGSSIS